ncbi:outer membrane efflux domain protein [Leptospira fainei serovar Hurstbridge str. BUT 6]|uniref:Outer membrane efflux domain protein n=1 Tax=Leptospira fainei serovar Hurstbridge str. BUT 6 TaxID=1193011 RepID=S3UZL5_9LEPT|nr:TolC family protein [Leptospira fainei]EPG73809.1 outer membrane efflux domain protein [Leptospira fainei serovar Hurstbridge str. BUT 6]
MFQILHNSPRRGTAYCLGVVVLAIIILRRRVFLLVSVLLQTSIVILPNLLSAQSNEFDPINLSIEEAVQLSLEKNLTLIAKKYDVDIAKADAIQAGLYRNPSFNALSSLNPFGPNYNQSTTGGPKQLDLLLNLPLDLSGKIRSGKKSRNLERR